MANDLQLTRLTYTEAFSSFDEWLSDAFKITDGTAGVDQTSYYYKIIKCPGVFLMLDPYSTGPLDIVLLGTQGDVVNKVRLYPGGTIECEFAEVKAIYEDRYQARRIIISNVGKTGVGAFKGDRYGSFADTGELAFFTRTQGITSAAPSVMGELFTGSPTAYGVKELLIGSFNVALTGPVGTPAYAGLFIYDTRFHPNGLDGTPVNNVTTITHATLIFLAVSQAGLITNTQKDVNVRVSAAKYQAYGVYVWHRSGVNPTNVDAEVIMQLSS